ncbi:HipA domain-containing protein [Paenarthrobacter sp. NPDC089714]|uniref:HipA domain-containing protein n=1 Tax=Paenarthrobacter sp. NPDC089714 TaxID=3364377 RepID=UPI00380EAE91
MEAAEGFVDLTGWMPAEDEPAGENEKTWFVAPDGSRWIFKRNRPQRSPNEHSSEFVASKVALLLGIPAAEIRLATISGELGCISRDVKSQPRHQLNSASLFIAEYANDFDPRARDGVGHSLENIQRVLQDVSPPIGHEGEGLTSAAWFAGYLVFDALIGNQDRHSENWSLELDLKGTYHLAPSYDHATSLGIVQRNDEKLGRLLGDREALNTFVARARGTRFENQTKTSLVDVAAAFCEIPGIDAGIHWGQKVDEIDLLEVEEIVASSRMSVPNDKLAIEVVRLNKERLMRCLLP